MGVPLSQIFRGSNAYDPDYTLTGGSITGYSSYSARYKKATILASSIKILVTDNGTDASNPFAVSIVPDRVAAAMTTDKLNNLSEVRYSK